MIEIVRTFSNVKK